MKIANVVLGGRNNYGPRLWDWLYKRRPDIVTIQKIGCDKDFREHEEKLRKIGYNSKFRGSRAGKSPLGVAVLSCRKLPEPKEFPGELPCNGGKSRFLAVRIGDVLVSSIYVPYSDKIGPRLDWLNLLREHVDKHAYACQSSVLCGDFNVRKIDDKSKGKLKEAMGELEKLGFCDLYRKAHPDPEAKPGRTRGYGTHPEGTSRLHLILASRSLAQRLGSAYTEPEPSLWPRKDAPPLVVGLDDIECANG